jgi:hypothetical protein
MTDHFYDRENLPLEHHNLRVLADLDAFGEDWRETYDRQADYSDSPPVWWRASDGVSPAPPPARHPARTSTQDTTPTETP